MKHPAPATFGLRDALAPVSQRLARIILIESAAAGFVFAIALSIIGRMQSWPIIITVVAGLAAAAVATIMLLLSSARRRSQLRFVAGLVEARAPRCRNLLITASELLDQPTTVRAEIGLRIQREAAALASSLKPAVLFPTRAATLALVSSASVWALILIVLAIYPSFPGKLLGASNEPAAIRAVDVSITPPSYAARPTQQLHNPDRIEALAGSRIRVTASGSASAIVLETLTGRQPLDHSAAGEFVGEIIADADGYIAIEPAAADGSAGTRRLIGLTMVPDHPPVAHVTAPGRDLFLPDSRRTIAVAVDANDDLALESLRLRYTRVSGSGEQFTFTEGDVPLVITRSDAKKWTARASWKLDSLNLVPGDIVVYRAVVADKRPGATLAESDSFILEITGPGALAAGGFSIDEERDRYAISQQMVILKSERLLARKSAMAADAYAAESQDIAAEQRKVRSEFVFMMGGELADEIAPDLTGTGDLDERSHAAMDDEAISGRLASNGRLDIVRALRSMSHASAALISVDVTQALVAEKEALAFLQRAFSRTRYILRSLTERERLDQARRLTGVMLGAATDRRPSAQAAVDSSIISLRRALAVVAELSGSNDFSGAAAARALSAAENVLRIDAAAEPLQRVAASLTGAATAMSASREKDARRLLDDAATGLALAIRGALLNAPENMSSIEAASMNGALVDALRRRREK